ncbi:zinc finger protein 839 isoform X2 [Paroedura picta]|uniref:zinc finger protein 839 isoform X2 n=1 Tax=Paroedura picta TaxID=143630 RepID=UPI004056410F
MAAGEESGGEVGSALSDGDDRAAPPGASLPLQLFQTLPVLVAEQRAAAEEGRPGEAPPGEKAASGLGLSFGLLQPQAPRNAGPWLAAPAPLSATRPFGGSADPSTEPLLVPRAPRNAAQQLQDVARRIALQQGRSEAASSALPPARLLPPQQLETICVQVQPDQAKENERPALSFATNQSRNMTTAQSVEKNAKVLGLNVINPQIIRIEPLTGTGSRQFFLHNSSGPTIQLLLQRPLHPHGQVSANKPTAHQILNVQRNKSSAETPSGTLVSKNPVNPIVNSQKKQRDQKLKKNLKVKTRSGRISRPPKYKAKDYKFIKTEDLADCHQSDSDDYSELSVEEDEEGKEKEMPLTYDLRPKLFKCQTCEKSYIGKGGLARHYKLNPDHGPQESSPVNQLCSVTLLEDTGKANDESSLQPPPQVTVTNEKAEALENGQQLIQQCTNEDFMELVVPHLTAFVTVFEFLLTKVKKEEPTKMLFPDVYREFEELHAMVMKMYQEYISNPEIKEPLEIKNPKVAESLGMDCNLFVVQNIQVGSSSEHSKIFGDHVFTEASGQKRAAENSDETLPLAKRNREQCLLENTKDYLSHHGMEEISATYEEERSAANSCCRSTLAKEHESLELEAAMDCGNPGLPCEAMNAGLENLQLSRTLGLLDHCPACLFSCDEIQPSVSAGNLQEEHADVSWNTASRPRGPESGNAEVSSQNSDLSALEENSHNEKYQFQQENEDTPIRQKVEQPENPDSVELGKYLPNSHDSSSSI